jgi:glycosyltransferase involved in cell wall biosynthesis
MKIAILGTRGIPNNYGGFEQLAEYLSVYLVEKGFEVTVYNSHNHPYQKKTWNGVNIVHCWDPEDKWGTAGQFIYDLNCIRHIRKNNFDVVLQLGYTSSTVWGWLLPKTTVVTTNMDGLEWKRSKYSKKVRHFLKYAEKWGVKYSDHWISDSVGITQYLTETYGIPSTYIPYGSHLFKDPDLKILEKYNLEAHSYDLIIARMEPENNIETILDGYVLSEQKRKFIIIGRINTPFGKYLVEKFKENLNIEFRGGIFDINVLNNIRHFSNLYFHGHSVGGTNPSLLEAMASQGLICANDNIFNKSILGSDAFYFKTVDQVADVINTTKKHQYSYFIDNNNKKIIEQYDWEIINNQYLNHILIAFNKGVKKGR